MRKLFELGGLVAAAVLIAFGVAPIVMGATDPSPVATSHPPSKTVAPTDLPPDTPHRPRARGHPGAEVARQHAAARPGIIRSAKAMPGE